jgi:collagenase-like PrtC family protease
MSDPVVPKKEILLDEVVFNTYRRLADDSVSMNFVSTRNNWAPEEIADLDRRRKTTGFLLYAKDPKQLADVVPTGQTKASEGRTMSQQLRYALEREWETYQPDISKEVHYERNMLDFINEVKARLPRGGMY